MTPIIATELSALPLLPVASLEPLQGNLKELSQRKYQKLKNSLLEFGVIFPFYVWKETNKLIDGHQRLRIFEREGWHIDVPVVYISATDEQDAKQKLLVVSSQYGHVTQAGFDEFTFDIDDDWIQETAHFDALPFVFSVWAENEGENDPYAEWDGMPEFENEDKTSYQAIRVHFKNEDEVREFGRLLNQSLTDKTNNIWYSQREQMDDGRDRYVT